MRSLERLRTHLLTATALLLIPWAARADGSPDINEVINATNFIVANQCSGTLISLKYRLVLTNDHCLEGYVQKAEKEETDERSGKVEKVTREVFKDMELKQKTYADFKEVAAASFQARILFHSAKFDLALLQIRAPSIPQTIYSHVLAENKKVRRGDHVYVVGNPHMLDANLNEGVVSSVSRSIHWDETNEDVAYYGVDAGVNPGNSGGALYDANLNLIGVPGASMRNSSGLGFAIPAENIRKFLTDHCYRDVWDDAADAQSHEACEKEKLDKVNAARAKAGLPALDPPKDDTLGRTSDVPSRDLMLRPDPPAPVAEPPAAVAPVPQKKSATQLFLDLIGSLTAS